MDKMKASAAAERLKNAIQTERLLKLATPEFSALLGKMASFYEGKSPPPTVEDFTDWTTSVEQKAQEKTSNFGAL